MGNSNKKPQDYDVIRSFKAGEWINKQKRGGVQIWENTYRNIHADVYPLTAELKLSDFEHYEMRYANNPDIVQVHNLQINKEANLCSKSADAHVFVQRIPYRLSGVNDLSQIQALTVLRSAYRGFNTLSSYYGPVEPYQDLICFNEQGRPKIWVNANLAQNRVQKQIKNTENSNEAYVNKIFDMVENQTIGKIFPQNLRNQFRQSNPKSYIEAQNIIQQFAVQQHIQIPPTIKPRNYQSNEFINHSNGVTRSLAASSHSISQNIQPVPQNSIINSYQPLQESIHHQSFFQNLPVVSNISIPVRQSRIFSTNQQPMPLRATMPPTSYYTFAQQTGLQTEGIKQSQMFPNLTSPISSKTIHINNQFVPNTSSGLILNAASTPSLRQTIAGGRPQIIYNNNTSSFTILPQSPINNAVSGTRILRSPSNATSPQNIILDSPTKATSPPMFRSNRPPLVPINATPRSNVAVPPIQIQRQESLGGQSQDSRSIRSSQVRTVQDSPSKSIAERRVLGGQMSPRQNPAQIVHSQIQAQPIQRPLNIQQQIPLSHPRSHFQFPPPVPASTTTPTFNPPIVRYQRPIIQQQQYQYHLQNFPQINIPRPIISFQSPQPQNIQTITDSVRLGEATQTQEPQFQPQPQKLTKSQQSNIEVHVQNHQFQQLPQQQTDQQTNVQIQQQINKKQIQLIQSDNLYNGQQQQNSQEHISQNNDIVPNNIPNEISIKIPQIKNSGDLEKTHSAYTNEKEILQQKQHLQTSNNFNTNNFDDGYQLRISHNINQNEQQHIEQINPQKQPIESTEIKQNINASEQQIQQNKNQIIGLQSKQSNPQITNSGYNDYTISGYTYMHRNKQLFSPKYNNDDRIPDNAKYEDIEQYIRNKYKTYIGKDIGDDSAYSYQYRSSVTPHVSNNKEPQVDVNKMADYVESKYDQYSQRSINNGPMTENAQFSFRPTPQEVQRSQKQTVDNLHVEQSTQIQQTNYREGKAKEQDPMLDVGFMEKSLDKKYSSLKSQQQLRNLELGKKESEFDVQKLQQNLIKFQQSRVGTKQAKFDEIGSEPRFETSQVSKINSIDYRLGNQRKSSTRKDFKDEIESYGTTRNFTKQYESQSPVYQYEKRNSSKYTKHSKDIFNIDQKFNKYVTNGNKNGYVSGSKTNLKFKQDNYGDNGGSRVATGHFGYTQVHRYEDSRPYETATNSKHYKNHYEYEQRKPFAVSEVTAHKNLTYDDLRKFLWS